MALQVYQVYFNDGNYCWVRAAAYKVDSFHMESQYVFTDEKDAVVARFRRDDVKAILDQSAHGQVQSPTRTV